LYSRSSPYSLSCHVGAMLMCRMPCRTLQFSNAQRTESVLVMGHELSIGVSSTRLV